MARIPVTLTRPMLLAMEQHTADLPIACVEGWSTTQQWTGVRLADLARLAGVAVPASAHVQSLDTSGGFGQARLQSNQVLDPDALLALKVNGVDLSSDHGLSGPHHRPRHARGALHQVGPIDRLRGLRCED